MRRGGKDVVVVVVVVTTVVRVAGAKENWAKESLLDGPCPTSSWSCSSMSRLWSIQLSEDPGGDKHGRVVK